MIWILLWGALQGTPFVIDGDTLIVNKHRVRLHAVDAPEMNEPGGFEARAFMQSITQQRITCTDTGERTHGRIVASCRNAQGDLGEQIIRAGYARSCPRYSRKYEHIKQNESLPRKPYCEVR